MHFSGTTFSKKSENAKITKFSMLLKLKVIHTLHFDFDVDNDIVK